VDVDAVVRAFGQGRWIGEEVIASDQVGGCLIEFSESPEEGCDPDH
jgi:hypothetical protein